MSEYLTHKGGDWRRIAGDLAGESELVRHLWKKASESCRQFGPERPFGETVTPEQARQIRKIAKERNCREIDGDAG